MDGRQRAFFGVVHIYYPMLIAPITLISISQRLSVHFFGYYDFALNRGRIAYLRRIARIGQAEKGEKNYLPTQRDGLTHASSTDDGISE